MSSVILTLEELAEYLKLPLATIQHQADQGKLPGRKIDENWRFLQAAIDDWLRGDEGPQSMIGDRAAIALQPTNSLANFPLRTSNADRIKLEQQGNPWAEFIGIPEDDAEFAAIAAELRAEQDF
jgi:excisionase family DNA binding protein